MVRAKFTVESVTEFSEHKTISLSPVMSDDRCPENMEFFKWTPGGKIDLQVVSKEVADAFIPGKSYYVDFTLAE